MKRKAFNFYASFDDTLSELNDEQFVSFTRTLLDVQFLRRHIEEVYFKDKIVGLLWNANKHSMKKQLEGYCSAQKIAYNSLFMGSSTLPTEGASKGTTEGTKVQVKGQEQEQEQEQGECKGILENPSKINYPKKSEVLDWWNDVASQIGCSTMRTMTDKRYKAFKTRLRNNSNFEDDIMECLQIASRSKFLMDSSWFSFDWLMKNDENYTKVLEGNYSGGNK